MKDLTKEDLLKPRKLERVESVELDRAVYLREISSYDWLRIQARKDLEATPAMQGTVGAAATIAAALCDQYGNPYYESFEDGLSVWLRQPEPVLTELALAAWRLNGIDVKSAEKNLDDNPSESSRAA